MKVSLSREALHSRLQISGRAVSTRTAMPSLGGILLEASGSQLSFRSTDVELSLMLSVDASVETEGSVLLPGRLLVDVVRSLPGGEVTLSLRPEERDVEIEAAGSTFHLRTLSVDEFPRLPEFEGEAVKLPAGPLAETVDRVARAASRDEVRPILTGVLVTASESTLTMVATDSYRLSVKHTELEQPIATELEANVPARAMKELSRLIAQEGADEVEIAMQRNQILFRCADIVLASRLIEGQFPSYRQLLPETFEHEVRLPREELLDVTRRVSQLAQRTAPLRFAFSEGELTVAAETPDVGDAKESMPAPYSGEPLEIAFNPQFLIEGVESVDTDEIAIQLTSPLRPGLLRPLGSEDFSYLVMPIRLNV
ncbi:MAG: DNA polymerase III subunit beta [Solirubrobacterales bacterium]